MEFLFKFSAYLLITTGAYSLYVVFFGGVELKFLSKIANKVIVVIVGIILIVLGLLLLL